MKTVAVLTVLIFGLSLVSCSNKQDSKQDAKLYVVTTTGMIADLAVNVGRDLITVVGLMGPGVDPHLYKASQGDIGKLSKSDVIFYNGLHLEGKMVDIFEKMARQKTVVPVSRDIDRKKLRALDANMSIVDPHIWFDVSLWRETIPVVQAILTEENPQHAEAFAANARRYAEKLDTLHQWVKSEIAQIPQPRRVLITAHDAFGYFGIAYEIEVHGLQGISTVAEYGVNDVTNLVDLIVGRGIKAAFVETSVPQRSIEAVIAGCQARGHEVKIGGSLYSDAMGQPGSGADTYIGMVTANVNTIVSALK